MPSETELQRLRTRPRLKLFQPTTMRDGTTTAKVHLLDLSATGALIHAATPPATGARVLVTCGPEQRTATVMWVEGNRFGVAFTVPLSDEQVAATIAPAEPARTGTR